MSADTFAGYTAGLTAPASRMAAVTPHDTNDLPVASRALWVCSAGNVALIGVHDTVAVTLSTGTS